GALDGGPGSLRSLFRQGAAAAGPRAPWRAPRPSPRARGRPRATRDGRGASRLQRSERRRCREAGRAPRASEPRTQAYRGTERAELGGNPFLLVRLDRVEILPRSEPVNVQDAVQVIGLVQHALGTKLVARERETFSYDVV